MSSGVALQAVLTGLAQGAVYGLVALGFTLCHRLVRVLNFAHGDLVTGALFAGLLATVGTTPVVTAPAVPAAVVQVAVTLGVGALLGAALYALAVRPFRSGAGWVAATLAAGLLLREVLSVVFTREAYPVADPLRLPSGVVPLGADGRLPSRALGVLVIGLVAGVLADQFVVRSRAGRAMRAVADDAETAALMGIAAARTAAAAFALAGALAGLAGLLHAPGTSVAVGSGVVLGLKGVAAALLGRLGSLRGALAGGLALGTVESLAVAWPPAGPAYRDALALALLVTVLALRPEGLRSRPERVVE